MSALINLGIKNNEGGYTNVTISINDETDDYGNNVAMWLQQTKEEREAKAKRTYIGNGKVVWNDGNIMTADKKEVPADQETDLPF